jgi:hypothetical protein
MKQQYVITHRYSFIGDRKTWLVMKGATLRHVMFYENIGRRNCFVKPTFWQNVTQLFSNAGILVWGIVWVVTNCCFMSHKLSKVPVYTMKACGRSNLSITWGGGGFRFRPRWLYPWEWIPVLIYYEEECVRALECLDTLEEREVSCSNGNRATIF